MGVGVLSGLIRVSCNPYDTLPKAIRTHRSSYHAREDGYAAGPFSCGQTSFARGPGLVSETQLEQHLTKEHNGVGLEAIAEMADEGDTAGKLDFVSDGNGWQFPRSDAVDNVHSPGQWA